MVDYFEFIGGKFFWCMDWCGVGCVDEVLYFLLSIGWVFGVDCGSSGV